MWFRGWAFLMWLLVSCMFGMSAWFIYAMWRTQADVGWNTTQNDIVTTVLIVLEVLLFVIWTIYAWGQIIKGDE